jgi:enoyl reductase
LALATASPAYAKKGFGDTDGETQQADAGDDGTLSVTAGGIVFDRSKNGTGNSAGALKSSTVWTPPPCWYAPKYTPEQLQKTLEPTWEAGSTGYEWDAEQRDRYVNGKPYKDFNKDKTGKGYFWDSFVDEDFPPGWDSCKKPAEIRVPGTKVTLAPAAATKVNLPTWAWLDAADFKPVSVTASVPVIGITATATARPMALRIEPGTKDAVTYPASGVCEINNDRIGEPYAKGKADQTPPCGVRYLRSSGNGTYPLQATVTWKIDWTGSGGAGGDLPDGTFGATQDVVVQEIQAVNR